MVTLDSMFFLVLIPRTIALYIHPILENGFYNTAVLPIGVNDLQKNSLSSVEYLSSVISPGKRCQASG